MVSKLEIPTLRSNFRADEDSCSLGIGEPCSIAIPLEESEVLMELCRFDLNTSEEKGSYGFSKFDRFADQDDFFPGDFLKKSSQPIYAGLEEIRFITCRRIKLNEVQLTLREARKSLPGIPEHDSAGAKTVDQVPREVFPAARVLVVEGG